MTKPRGAGEGDIPDPSRVLFVAVIDHYLEHHAAKIPGEGPARLAARIVTQWLFELKNRPLPRTAKADCFSLDLQEKFVEWSAQTKRHSASYIARNLGVIASAMQFAAREEAIDDEDEGRRIVRLMTNAPKVHYDLEWIARTGRIPVPQKRTWVPTFAELARFIDCARSEHAFRYLIVAINTWARASTIMEIDFRKQVDLDAGILDLNTPGRVQTIKRRPVIRLTRNLRAWLAEWKAARPLTWHGAAVDDVKRAMQATNARWMMMEAGFSPERIEQLMAKGAEKERTKAVQELDAAGAHRITRRVIRSFMGTRIRGQKEIRVDREQREIWLGHQAQDTTSRYEIADPDYLREAADATDLIINKLQAHCRRSLWPEGHQPELPLGKPARLPDSHTAPTTAKNRESRSTETDN